jgi:hypothetical protein
MLPCGGDAGDPCASAALVCSATLTVNQQAVCAEP